LTIFLSVHILTVPSPDIVFKIEVHPYIYDRAKPIIEFCSLKGIIIQAYGTLAPLIHYAGGPVDPVVQKVARELGATESQVLLKWAHQVTNGGPVVTTSSKEERLKEHIQVFTEIKDLSDVQMSAIAEAGKQSPQPFRVSHDSRLVASLVWPL
jgi:diketogulonate reductase-like aldo/keto reductase